MKRTLSFANSPRLDKHENPKSANVKKKRPRRFWNPAMSFLVDHCIRTCNEQMTSKKYIRDVMIK
jgi:hypothetical protein